MWALDFGGEANAAITFHPLVFELETPKNVPLWRDSSVIISPSTPQG